MNSKREIQFPGDFRIHFGLAVSNIEAATQFYSQLLGVQPAKVRPGYAKFEPLDPSLNLSLNQVSRVLPSNAEHHFGIQVKSHEQLQAVQQRLLEAGITPRIENGISCCYAIQDKLWVSDPDGNKWEVFLVLESDANDRSSSDGCCDEDCCDQPPIAAVPTVSGESEHDN